MKKQIKFFILSTIITIVVAIVASGTFHHYSNTTNVKAYVQIDNTPTSYDDFHQLCTEVNSMKENIETQQLLLERMSKTTDEYNDIEKTIRSLNSDLSESFENYNENIVKYNYKNLPSELSYEKNNLCVKNR